MLNAPHILATALLLLTAFLIGAVLGSLARAAANRLLRKPAGAASAIVVNPVTSAEPALVLAPVIEPLPNPATPVAPENVPTPDFAETMMALATGPLPEIKMPTIAPLPAVAGARPVGEPLEPLQPARVAGETTAGRHIVSPHIQPVSPSPTVAVDSQSAEVILFPSQPAPASTAGAVAELESLLGQAVAADAEALKTDEHEPADGPSLAATPPEPDAIVSVPDPTALPAVSEAVIEATQPDAVITPFIESMAEPEPVDVAADDTADASTAGAESAPPASEAEAEAEAAPEVTARSEPPQSEDLTIATAASDAAVAAESPAIAESAVAETAEQAVKPSLAEASPELAAEPVQKNVGTEPDPEAVEEMEPTKAEAIEIAPIAAPVAVVETPSPPVAESPAVMPSKISAEEEEAAAMRAIEGNWSPRRKPTRAARPAALPDAAPETAADALKVSAAAVAAAAQAASAVVEPEPDPGKPAGLSAPRQGGADDLTRIIGVLPIIETALNNLGIFHFDQLSELGDAQVGWVETHLGISGRIGREHWREQAGELALLGRLKVAAES